MKRLYWYEWEPSVVKDAGMKTGVSMIGGLGLNIHKTNVISSGEVGKEHGMLGIGSGFDETLPKESMEEGRLVSVKNCKEGELVASTFDKECFITAGKNYYDLLHFDFKKFKKTISDQPHFTTTQEGEEADYWQVKPLLILPLYDGELDKEYGYWEMFEEEGYIYGQDRRTGEIYDLQHIEVKLASPFGNRTEVWEAWVISNQPVTELFHLFDNSPMGEVDTNFKIWVKMFAMNNFEFRLAQINHIQDRKEKVTVERYK